MFAIGAVCLCGALLLPGGGVTPSAIRVQGATTCPTAGQVESALVGMVSPHGSATVRDVVELTMDETVGDEMRVAATSVRVRLKSATGEWIAERRLPEGKSCAERARVAAVIVAAWEVRLYGGTQPTLPSVSGARTTEPVFAPAATPPLSTSNVVEASRVAPSAAVPVPVPIALTVLAPAPTPVPTPAAAAPVLGPASARAPFPAPALASRPRDSAIAFTVQPNAAPAAPVDWEMGAEALTSVVASDVAKGAMIELRLARPASVFAGSVSGLGIDAHTRPVGSGQGRWRRFGGIIDLRSVARWRPVELEVRLGLALTVVAVEGQAFPVTQGTTLFDPGGVAGLRTRFRLGRLVVWTDATAAFWPRAHNLYVTGDTTSADLPAFELLLGVGLSFRVPR